MNKNLKDMGLRSLRVYARKIGVKSPTSYTFDNLIKEVEKVENGSVKPYYSNRGRPVKDKNIFDSVTVNKMEQEHEEKIKAIKELTQKFIKDLNTLL